MNKDSIVIVYLKLLMTATFWGGTFIAGRVIAQNVRPFSAAFLRFAIASIFLLFLTWKLEGKFPKLRKHQIVPIFLLGMIGVFTYNFFFFKGMKLIEAGRASVIIANNPIFIALLAAYFFKEKLTPLKIIGILISVTGAIVVITRGHVLEIFQGSVGPGELYIFGCVASWVTYSLIGKVAMKDLSPLLSVTYSVLVGAAALLLPAYLEGITRDFFHYSTQEWVSLFYLGFFGTVLGFIWYYQGIQRIGPMKAGLFINFVPISGVLLAFLILKEPITFSLIIGLIFVSIGVYLTNRRTSVKAPERNSRDYITQLD
jgi:drug/metabolite transporter (DMT)-like permease